MNNNRKSILINLRPIDYKKLAFKYDMPQLYRGAHNVIIS